MLLVQATSGHAQDYGGSCRKTVQDVGDKYALSRILLGGNPSKLPGIRQRWLDCGQVWNKDFRKIPTSSTEKALVAPINGGPIGLCHFTGPDGVTYTFSGPSDGHGNYSAEGPFSLYAEDILDLTTYRGHLVADVRPGDSFVTVYHKLKSLPVKFQSWMFVLPEYPEGPSRFAMTRYCLQSSDGSDWFMYLYFDLLGRLKSVGAIIDMGGGDDAGYSEP